MPVALLIAAFLFIFTLGGAHATEARRPPCPGEGHGRLLIHGGGGGVEHYTRRGLALCGGLDARVAVIPDAMGERDPANSEQRERLLEEWMQAGATHVTLVDISDQTSAIAAVSDADYVFFSGGSQRTLMERLSRFPTIVETIRRRHAQGALIGGMSAGAAVMSQSMIAGPPPGAPGQRLISSESAYLEQGLGFWPAAILDQHFIIRGRFARLMSAVLDRPDRLGVGIDEATAILVSRNSFEVFGEGAVIVIDPRRARIAPTRDRQVLSGRNLRIHALRAGDTFRW